jgi:hypothetical protein
MLQKMELAFDPISPAFDYCIDDFIMFILVLRAVTILFAVTTSQK